MQKGQVKPKTVRSTLSKKVKEASSEKTLILQMTAGGVSALIFEHPGTTRIAKSGLRGYVGKKKKTSVEHEQGQLLRKSDINRDQNGASSQQGGEAGYGRSAAGITPRQTVSEFQ